MIITIIEGALTLATLIVEDLDRHFKRLVSVDAGAQLGAQFGFQFFETSAVRLFLSFFLHIIFFPILHLCCDFEFLWVYSERCARY